MEPDVSLIVSHNQLVCHKDESGRVKNIQIFGLDARQYSDCTGVLAGEQHRVIVSSWGYVQDGLVKIDFYKQDSEKEE